MTDVRALGYLGVHTSHVEEWQSFAAEVLGAIVGSPLPDGSLPVRLDDRSHRIALVPAVDDGIAFVGWEVADGSALAKVADRLRAAGWALTDATAEELAARQVQAMLWTTDPAGNRVEFACGQVRINEAVAYGRPIAGFVTGDLGLGHLVVQAADPSAALGFYRDVLGFRLRDQLSDALWFLGCNPRHHSIGIADIGGPARLLHVMVEVRELDDLGKAFDLCLDRAVPVSMIGLHANDRMLSFYVRTPSGFEVEYGWNGLLVDDATWVATTIDRPSIWGHRQMDVEHPPRSRPFQRVRS